MDYFGREKKRITAEFCKTYLDIYVVLEMRKTGFIPEQLLCIVCFFLLPGKRGRLLSLPERQQTQLQNFLQQDEFGYLKWLHDIECKDFKSVSRSLCITFAYE